MAVTIANLEYQNDTVFLRSLLIDTYAWLSGCSIVEGYKGKATVADFSVTDFLLIPQDCVLDTIPLGVKGKQVEIVNYGFSIPVERCDLHGTWLAHFARTYNEAPQVYYENLMPYLIEKVGAELRYDVVTDIMAEAALDTAVQKITVTAYVDTPEGAKATLDSFIHGMGLPYLTVTFGDSFWRTNTIYVSPKLYTKFMTHGDGDEFYAGFYIEPEVALSGAEMFATPKSNILVAFDSTEDVNQFKVVPKDELNTDYIVGSIAFGGSYLDSSRIVISA